MTTPPTPTSPKPDAGVSFDPMRPFKTRDGHEVGNFHSVPTGWAGSVKSGEYVTARVWRRDGRHAFGERLLDLVNNVPPPSTPEPADAGQVEGEVEAVYRAWVDRYGVDPKHPTVGLNLSREAIRYLLQAAAKARRDGGISA